MIANLAVVLAGKIPVNLNFTAGPEAIESAMRQSELDLVITANQVIKKVPNFPWPSKDRIMLLDRMVPKLKKKVIYWLFVSKLFSVAKLERMLGIPTEGGDREIALLFTSGSSGEPKGVPLTHRNILGNVAQFAARLRLDDTDKLLGSLPIFHSFGFTVSMWYPMIYGVNLVTYPSPLDSQKNAELIEKYKVTVHIATATFLRSYLRKVDPEKLKTLKLLVVGAEKLPLSLSETFYERFGIQIMEGYGLTETSPATNANLPDPTPEPGKEFIPSFRLGAVGHLLPGIAVRIADPDTDAPRSLFENGMIWMKGVNIFHGYLGLEDVNREVVRDGWFKTGDLGRMDADCFLYIEGRVSRFSKIAGEMVPHETVEDKIAKVLDLTQEGERKVVVVGMPDEAKGEALVLLTSIPDLDLKDLRYKLLDSGLSPLWIPKRVIVLDEIPLLASGKLDLGECRRATVQALA